MDRLPLILRKFASVFSPLGSQRPHRHSPRTWRRRRLSAAILLILLVALIGGYWHFTSRQRVREQVVKALRQITGGEVQIDQAGLDIFREINIHSLRVYLPGRLDDPQALVFSAQEVLLEHEPWTILTRRLRLKTIKAQSAHLHIWYDRKRNLTNLQLLNVNPDTTAIQRPTILLRQSTVDYMEIDGQKKSPVIRQNVSGRIFPDPDNEQIYQFEFRSMEEGVVKNSSWQGRYNIHRKELIETTGNFFLELIDISNLPDRVSAWQRLYDVSQPKGEVTTQSRYDPQKGQTVRLSIQNGSLLLPMPDVKIPLRQVTAEILCTTDTIEIERLSGRYEDYCQFDAQGRIGGYDAEASFDLNITLENFDIPQGYWQHLKTTPKENDDSAPATGLDRLLRLIDLLPDSARKLILTYTPTGQLDTHLHIKRGPQPDDDTQYDGTLICRNARLVFDEFPYPINNVQGSVHYEHDNIIIGPLISGNNDQVIQIAGYWKNQSDQQEYQVAIEASNTPLDQTLYNAMSLWQKKLWNQFNPTGKINAVYRISRAPHQDRTDSLEVELLDVDAAYQKFPVVLNTIRGNLKWQKHQIDFDFPQAFAGNGPVQISGKITQLNQPRQQLACSLNFKNIDLAPPLTDQLPESLRNKIRYVGLQGQLSGQAQIWSHDQNHQSDEKPIEISDDDFIFEPLQYHVKANIENGTLKPEIFNYEIQKVIAKGELTNENLIIESFIGQNGKGQIRLTGHIAAPDDFELHIDADPLELNENLQNALNLQNVDLWNTFRPKGLVNVAMDIHRTPPQQAIDYRAVVKPLDTELSFSDLGSPLGKATGKIIFEPRQTTIESLTITNKPTTITAKGNFNQQPEHLEADLQLTMKSLQCNDTLFAALPNQLDFLHERLNLTGTIDADLRATHHQSDEQSGKWLVQGRLDVHNGAIKKPLLTENIYGNIQGQADYDTAANALDLSGTITCPSLSVKKRPLKNLTGKLDYKAAENILTISDISSGLCDGRMAGQVQTFLKGNHTGYQMDLTFGDVDLAQLLEAEKEPDQRKKNLRGLVNGRFSMNQPTDITSRRGNFAFEVKDAVLGSLPLFGQLFHVFNLSLPREGAFNEASLAGDIIGDKSQFDTIVLKGSAFKLSGAGIMISPDDLLDLVFVMNSPHDLPDLPVISSFIKAIQPELMQVRVTGPFEDPLVEPIALPGLDKAIKQFDNHPENQHPPQKPLPPPPPTTK